MDEFDELEIETIAAADHHYYSEDGGQCGDGDGIEDYDNGCQTAAYDGDQHHHHSHHASGGGCLVIILAGAAVLTTAASALLIIAVF